MDKAKWLVDQDLVYTLKDGANHWEVRVSMVAGSRDMADRSVAANQLRTILEKANEQASQPPAGYTLVPIEPTPEMAAAFAKGRHAPAENYPEAFNNGYRAMIKVAPKSAI